MDSKGALAKRNYPTPLEWAKEMYNEMQKPEWKYAKKHKKEEFDQFFHMKYADFELACPFLFDKVMSDPHLWEREEMKLIVATASAQLKGKLSKPQADAKIAQTFTSKYVKQVLTKDEPSIESQQALEDKARLEEQKPKKKVPRRIIEEIRAKQRNNK